MTKKLAINLLKYVLAIGLLTWVIWSNWGHPDRVASVITDETNADAHIDQSGAATITGTVVSYKDGHSITIEAAGESATHFDITGKTKLLLADETTLTPGTKVALWEGPRGLSYVWHHHILAGEEKTDALIFFFALCVTALAMLITMVRWWVLVRAQDIPLPLSDAIRLGSVGIFFNTFLPGSVGGDIIKATFIARERTDRRTTAVATVLLDRAIALWGLICFMVIAGAIFWSAGQLNNRPAQRIVMTAGVLVGTSLLCWLLMGFLPEWRLRNFAGRLGRIPKVGHAFSEIWNAVWMYRCRQSTVAVAVVLSWTAHIGFLISYYWAARTLSPASQIPSLAEHFVLLPIGMVIQAIPLFPGGAGISELGFGGLYQLFGFAAAAGVLMSLVQRVINWIIGGVCYLVYLRMKPAIQATLQESTPVNEPVAVPTKVAC